MQNRPGPKKKDDEAPVALYGHCVKTYNELLRNAKGVVQEGQTIVVWEGMLTHFITSDLNLSVPYYTSITSALKRMGCIRQLKRGGGTAPSQWELLREPTEELFNNAIPKKTPPRPSKVAHLEGRISDHDKRLKVLEAALKVIIEEQESLNG